MYLFSATFVTAAVAVPEFSEGLLQPRGAGPWSTMPASVPNDHCLSTAGLSISSAVFLRSIWPTRY